MTKHSHVQYHKIYHLFYCLSTSPGNNAINYYKIHLFCFIWRGSRYTEVTEKGLTHDVVMSLISPLLGKGYHVFTDNFYTSPALCQSLLDTDTDMTGTVRANRKNLPVAMKNKVQKGEVRYFKKGDILALKWHDKKDVRLLSTVARPHNLTTVHGRTHRGKQYNYMHILLIGFNISTNHWNRNIEYTGTICPIKLVSILFGKVSPTQC